MSDTQSKIGEQIDELYELRAKRLEKQKEIDELKKDETNKTKKILDTLTQIGLESASGHLATFSYSEVTVPKLVDFKQVKEYIINTGNVHLLGRRISAPAYRELVELFGNIPGVESYTFNKHSLTRSKK